MEWLNYHHLFYFWTVAREGGIARASARLLLAPPTISGQVHRLEMALGEKLFDRVGRRLVLNEMGRVVFRYADEIFPLGRELLDTVRGRPTGRPLRLVVGIVDAIPKLVARRLLDPVLRLRVPIRLVCREDRPDRLLAELARHALDVVLSDAPVGPGSSVRAFSHLLGECGVTFFAAKGLAARCRRTFPRSLDGAPVLLPAETAGVRRSLDQWFEALAIRPEVVGEFEDSALMKVFGRDGLGVFPAPTVLEREVRQRHRVQVVGRTDAVRERFYAIALERRLKHPAVVAVCQSAQPGLTRPA